jgi:hypothetical protein
VDPSPSAPPHHSPVDPGLHQQATAGAAPAGPNSSPRALVPPVELARGLDQLPRERAAEPRPARRLERPSGRERCVQPGGDLAGGPGAAWLGEGLRSRRGHLLAPPWQDGRHLGHDELCRLRPVLCVLDFDRLRCRARLLQIRRLHSPDARRRLPCCRADAGGPGLRHGAAEWGQHARGVGWVQGRPPALSGQPTRDVSDRSRAIPHAGWRGVGLRTRCRSYRALAAQARRLSPLATAPVLSGDWPRAERASTTGCARGA